MNSRCSYQLQEISTHSLTRRLTAEAYRKRLWILYFNSQPHKEADLVWLRLLVIYPYFNSQPHKEADNVLCKEGESHDCISTHSLTRRLTYELSM